MNIQLIDFQSLRSVSATELSLLPHTVSVYFALNNEGELLYIGKAVNLNYRWRNHHKLSRLVELGFSKLCWLESEIAVYSELEASYINEYKPLLNGRRKNP